MTREALKTFLVVALYDDNKQRYSDRIDAATAEEAEDYVDEEMAHHGTPVTVAAVFELQYDVAGIPEDFEALKLVR